MLLCTLLSSTRKELSQLAIYLYEIQTECDMEADINGTPKYMCPLSHSTTFCIYKIQNIASDFEIYNIENLRKVKEEKRFPFKS